MNGSFRLARLLHMNHMFLFKRIADDWASERLKRIRDSQMNVFQQIDFASMIELVAAKIMFEYVW